MTDMKNEFIYNLKKIKRIGGLYIADTFKVGEIEYIDKPFYLDCSDIDLLFDRPSVQGKYMYFIADDIFDNIYRILKDETEQVYRKEMFLVPCGTVDFTAHFFMPISLQMAKDVCKVKPLTVDYYERVKQCWLK